LILMTENPTPTVSSSSAAPKKKANRRAYFHSATTLNYLRALLSSGFASLHSPQEWSLGHVRSSTLLKEYTTTVTSVLDCLDFMAHIGADNPFVSEVLERTEIFTSHEALLLDYEEKLTRSVSGGGWIDGSAHYVWVGERTRDLDGAHIEFIRGVENPIGIKLGPTLEGEELVRLLDIVNPNCEIGKVTLISRYGHKNVPHLVKVSEIRLLMYFPNISKQCIPRDTPEPSSSPVIPCTETP
jgi:3-deoxy-7-phosphoheptulonate synthase